MMNVVNPTVFYVGLIVLAGFALVGSYFHVVPIEVFNTILGAILGSSVTLASQVTILAKEAARKEAILEARAQIKKEEDGK